MANETFTDADGVWEIIDKHTRHLIKPSAEFEARRAAKVIVDVDTTRKEQLKQDLIDLGVNVP